MSTDAYEAEATKRLLKLRELVQWQQAGECVVDARRLVYANEDVPADYDFMINSVCRLLRASARYHDVGDGVMIRSMDRRISAMLPRPPVC